MNDTSKYTNDFKDMAGNSPLAVKAQRTFVLKVISDAVVCQFTGVVLDRKSTVVILPSSGKAIVITADLWDTRHEAVAAAAAGVGGKFEVFDGRELW